MAGRALFVYGTLHPDRAPVGMRGVVERFRLVGRGSVVGERMELLEYPGVVMDGRQDVVPGTVFAVPDEPEVWRALDAYEGFDPADVAGSLFRREEVDVAMEDGREERCWIYLYNRRMA